MVRSFHVIVFKWCMGLETAGLTHLISIQRSDGVFLLETEWLFEGL
jgi:hypothetical protein